MKNRFLFWAGIMGIWLFFGAQSHAAQSVIGKITSIVGGTIRLDIGSATGLMEGDTGRIYFSVTIGGEKRNIYVAKFKIYNLTQNSCLGQVEDKTRELEVGFLAEIKIEVGELEIRSNPPGAKIYLDSKSMGETPLAFSKMRVGSYLIKVILEGYEPHEERIDLFEGDKKFIIASLQSRLGDLKIVTEPSGANIYIDGRLAGKGPYFVKGLSAKSYRIRVEMDGYEPWEEEVIVQARLVKDIQAKLGPPKTFINSLGMKFVLISANRFTMGSPENESGRDKEEGPQQEIDISRSFYLGRHEVTQGQWRELMGYNRSYFKNCGDDCPVEMVSWQDVQEFISELNKKEKTNRYRLPTEAEWEFACRAGSRSTYGTVGRAGSLDEYALYSRNSGSKTNPVGQKGPNLWGLFDMHGNVWEWCQDWHGKYEGKFLSNPSGPGSGTAKIARGGSWGNEARHLRCAQRNYFSPTDRRYNLGFRLVRDP